MKKLINMTWSDIQQEMSIAGSPEKIAAIGKEVMDRIEREVDWTNMAELINVSFALSRINAEIKMAIRVYEKKNRIEIG